MARARDNPFISKIYFWWIIAPVISFVLFPLLLQDSTFRIAPDEIEFVRDCGRNVESVTASATAAFRSAFVETQVVAMTVGQYERAEDSDYRGYARIGTYMHAYMTRMWLMVFRAMWRLDALWPLCLVGFFGIFLPFLTDGLVVRAKRRSEFGLYNPISFNISGTGSAIFIGWLFYLPLVPWPLSSLMLFGFFMGLGLMTYLTVGSFQSRT
ncbi:DUF4400 domain-containing protein [Paraburkholderia sp. J8-2]|uniref:DUF4400 domain-containing protein n=1 Tax=Paraburkholderia sp. J8-2 TaxID=2805440 RepID=UPI002AB7D34F|nr:DUF4400 domain-containing protein [Paraburkholderia sp. J8-2]